jgi:uncharacterized phage protein gp47/JayE
MADLPTASELVQTGQGVYRTALDPGGTGAVNLNPGSRNDTLLSAMVGLLLRLTRTTADRIAGSRLSSAVDDELDLIGNDLFAQPRKLDVAAVGNAFLQRTNTGATVIPAGSRFQVPPANNSPAVLFQSLVDVAVGSGVTTGVAVPIQAVQTGYSGNVALSAVTKILDPLPDTSWTLYVPTPPLSGPPPTSQQIGGGAPIEDDETYRARLKQIAINDTRVLGVRRAVLAAVLAVPGVAFATIIEPLDGTIVVYAGDANYALPAALANAISTALLDVRGFGVPALIRQYNVVVVAVTGTLYMARPVANYNTTALQTAAIAAITRYFTSERPAPDEYYVNRIEAAMLSASAEAQDCALSAPSANVQRPADSAYGSVVALNRYVVTPASIQIAIAGPRTL